MPEVAQLRRQDVLDDATPPVLIVMNRKDRKQRVIPLAPQVIDALFEAQMPVHGYHWLSRQLTCWTSRSIRQPSEVRSMWLV